MVHIQITLFAAVAALSMTSANPVGYGAESYSSVSTSPVLVSGVPAVQAYAAPAVQAYAAPAVQAYAAPAVQAYAAPAVQAYAKVVEPEIIAYPRYAFKYGVEDQRTGDNKDQAEERDGDLVKGQYSLLQPDGRKRVVNYICAEKSGCNTVVSYIGQAVHPEVVKVVQPVQVQVPVKVASPYGGSYASVY